MSCLQAERFVIIALIFFQSLLSQKEELKKTVKELEEELENQVSSEEAGRLEQIEKQVKLMSFVNGM